MEEDLGEQDVKNPRARMSAMRLCLLEMRLTVDLYNLSNIDYINKTSQ